MWYVYKYCCMCDNKRSEILTEKTRIEEIAKISFLISLSHCVLFLMIVFLRMKLFHYKKQFVNLCRSNSMCDPFRYMI